MSKKILRDKTEKPKRSEVYMDEITGSFIDILNRCAKDKEFVDEGVSMSDFVAICFSNIAVNVIYSKKCVHKELCLQSYWQRISKMTDLITQNMISRLHGEIEKEPEEKLH